MTHAYRADRMPAAAAKFEAQKIAFSPLTFQAANAILELGICKAVSDSADTGLTVKQIAAKTGCSEYGVQVLAEIGLGMGIFSLADTDAEERYLLAKTGYFLLEDEMTRVNFNFTRDVCYKGADKLTESVKNGKPEGLSVFGSEWDTIYEALSSLPEQAKKSWFGFDHFYSDIAFPHALPIVFSEKTGRLLDIGGNTAKWAIACCAYDPNVHIVIADLPGQTAAALQNAEKAGYGERISAVPCDILDTDTKLPEGCDTVWMSQFLDCFSLEQITHILTKIHNAANAAVRIFVLEPLWDKQRFEAAAYSLQATSLYFTCMANGCSKMYRYGELVSAITRAGFELKTAHHNLGSNCYSLLEFRRI